MQSVNPVIIRRWAELGSKLEPKRRLALLGGHPRSGTTLLEQALDSHPDITSAEETNHFQDYVGTVLDRRWPTLMPLARVIDSTPNDALLMCRKDYFLALELSTGVPTGTRLLLDKNPSLTAYVAIMVRVFPEMKFLIALRDPRDVIVSCFMQPMLPVQPVNATWLSLDTAVDEYVALMTTWVTWPQCCRIPICRCDMKTW